METILEVQICDLCESTDVHYSTTTETFICGTCGRHMKQATAKPFDYKTGKLIKPVLLLLFLCMALLSKSQFMYYKDTAITFYLRVPAINQQIISVQGDTLLVDTSYIHYVKINKDSTGRNLAKLLNPVPFNSPAQLLIDSLKHRFPNLAVTIDDAGNVYVGNGGAIKLPNNNSSCLPDISVLTGFKNADSSLYYYDAETGILKGKPKQISLPITVVSKFTSADVPTKRVAVYRTKSKNNIF